MVRQIVLSELQKDDLYRVLTHGATPQRLAVASGLAGVDVDQAMHGIGATDIYRRSSARSTDGRVFFIMDSYYGRPENPRGMSRTINVVQRGLVIASSDVDLAKQLNEAMAKTAAGYKEALTQPGAYIAEGQVYVRGDLKVPEVPGVVSAAGKTLADLLPGYVDAGQALPARAKVIGAGVLVVLGAIGAGLLLRRRT